MIAFIWMWISKRRLEGRDEDRAVRFYERMGLERLAETNVPKIAASHSVPPHIRMVKQLG